jgi:hypothetical protein
LTEGEKSKSKKSWLKRLSKALSVASSLTLGPSINFTFVDSARKAEQDKTKYAEKLETATDKQAILKYLLLIDISALEGYIAQTRIQAEQSFNLSKNVAVVGFVLIAIGTLLGIFSNYVGLSGIDAAYLSALAGILSEFISGVFFYLYNKTLTQLNLFHDKMLASKQKAIALLSNTFIDDKNKRNESFVEISKVLVESSEKKI